MMLCPRINHDPAPWVPQPLPHPIGSLSEALDFFGFLNF